MFLLGVRMDHGSTTACLVVLEKTLKNVRHHYDIQIARAVPAAVLGDEIRSFYEDSAYTIRKRIYSQDRRPQKDVSAHPTIVMAADREEMPLIESLRREDVPVEAVLLSPDSSEPLPPPARAGIGRNHTASEHILLETMRQVLGQQRLAGPVEEGPPTDDLLTELMHMVAVLRKETPETRPAPLLTAAAAPIWFREKVPYTSAYRTSATSIRRFI